MAVATNHWRLGLFVVIGFALAATGLVWLGREYFRTDTMDIVTYFDESVQGLEEGSQVKMRGILVGSVTLIGPAPDGRRVEVRAQLDRTRFCRICLIDPSMAVAPQQPPVLPEDVRAQLALSGITGQKFLQIDFFDAAKYAPMSFNWLVPDGHLYIPSVPSSLKGFEEALIETLESLPGVADRSTALMERVLGAIDELEVKDLSGQIRGLMERIEGKLDRLDVEGISRGVTSFLGRGEQSLTSLEATLDELRSEDGAIQRLGRRADALMTRLDESLASAQVAETAASLRQVSGALAESATGTSREAAAVGERFRRLSDELEADLVVLRRTLEAFRSLAELLERDPGVLLHGKSPGREPESARGGGGG